MPIISVGTTQIILPQLATTTITPGTLNYLGGSGASQSEQSGYSFTISDVRVCQTNTGFIGTGITSAAAIALENQNANKVITNGTSVSSTVIGTTLSLVATGNNILFGTNTIVYATLTVIGLDSGARVQVPVQVTRTTTS